MLYGSRGLLNLARRRAGRDPERTGERGQILILFCLVIVVLMVAASIVVDVGLLRTDAARLQNALDAGAMAAAHDMPAKSANVGAITARAQTFTTTNYPGLGNPNVSYACLIGLNDATGLPRITDMPTVCNVSLAANSPDWVCTATVCWAPCDPVAHSTDVCNTVILTDSATQPYSFGRVVGINSRSTGTKVSAACNGPCGVAPVVPVDVVVLLDRTGSMDQSNSVDNLRSGGLAVLEAFDPTLQRVALGFTGPTSPDRTTGGDYGGNASSNPTAWCTSPSDVHHIALRPMDTVEGPAPNRGNTTNASNTSPGGSGSLTLTRPSSTASGDLMLATIMVSRATTFSSVPSGWALVGTVTNGSGATGIRFSVYRATGSVAGSGPYTWSWTTGNAQAVGGVVSYSGVDTSGSGGGIDTSSTNNGTTGRVLTANAVNPVLGHTALVGFYGIDARTTLTPQTPATPPTLTGLGEWQHASATTGATGTVEIATADAANANSTGTKVSNAATGVSAAWGAILVALKPNMVPVDSTPYGTNTATDVGQWVPIGFSGTDTDTPTLGTGGTYNEAYVDAAHHAITSSHVAQAIGCFDVSGVGTNLSTPLRMARQYLLDHGRPNTLWGVIIETDGTPNRNAGATYGNSADFTCSATQSAADALKATNSGNGKPIELFTIGYGLESQPVCPDNASRTTIQLLASMATSSSTTLTRTCDANENTDGDHFFCSPAGGDLAAILRAAAQQLVAGSRLVQMYGQPIVSSVAPNTNGVSGMGVAITGKYFTDAYSVTFGGVEATRFTIVSDTQINAVAPAHANGTVDIVVSSPGGSSKIVGVDHFTYGP